MATATIHRGAVFDPETIELLKSSLEQAWNLLGPDAQAVTTKSLLAERILRAAAQGERDPIRLRTSALIQVVSPGLGD